MNKTTETNYNAPLIEVVSVQTERGFAESWATSGTLYSDDEYDATWDLD